MLEGSSSGPRRIGGRPESIVFDDTSTMSRRAPDGVSDRLLRSESETETEVQLLKLEIIESVGERFD